MLFEESGEDGVALRVREGLRRRERGDDVDGGCVRRESGVTCARLFVLGGVVREGLLQTFESERGNHGECLLVSAAP